ncbi:MAG: CRISPR-associated endonuclease Cas2 [Xanthomonadaceae bacterium]|nr:CRISPR-associated endonuclease Cas2 [Xanthomonadaceae bacterium]
MNIARDWPILNGCRANGPIPAIPCTAAGCTGKSTSPAASWPSRKAATRPLMLPVTRPTAKTTSMEREHLYIVAYDISDAKRWRQVFRIMKGYGEWLQLSIFQCRLNRARHAELIAMLDEIISNKQDHLVIIDVGVADNVDPKVTSLGKAYKTVQRGPIIV